MKTKVYTVPGQVHYETTRRQVLAGADGVVMVADSDPEAEQRNKWAMENLRLNLRANGMDPDKTPIVIQWNKRDLSNARPVSDMVRQLNRRGYVSHEAVATSGKGVVETFGSILKQTIVHTYNNHGKGPVSEDLISQTVDEALAQSRAVDGGELGSPTFDHRFDMEKYRDEQGSGRRIVDESSLLSEAVRSNMMLAEQLDEYRDTRAQSERRGQLMSALGDLAPMLADPRNAALPPGAFKLLMESAGRRQGGLLLFKGEENVMDERESFPENESDPLNELVPGLGSTSYRLAKEGEFRVIEDLASEIFFDDVPGNARNLACALVAPLKCDGLAFGSLQIYALLAEPAFDEAEREYWKTASTLIGLSLHWRALRRKVEAIKAS